MIEELKYQYSIANDTNVIKIANELLQLEEYKGNYEILMHKAQSQINLYEEKNALNTYQEVIDLYPNKIEPKINISLCLLDIGEFLEARKNLELALKIDPENFDVINNLIYVEEELHNFERVLELTKRALKIDDKDPSIWLTLATTQERLGHYQESISNNLKAIEICEKDEFFLQLAYNNLGYVYSKMNDLSNAESYLNKAIEIDETDPFNYSNLGLVLAKKGGFEEGLNYINQSIKMDDTNSYAYKNRAKVYLMQGKTELAKKDLMKAKNMDYEIDYDNEVNELLENL